MKKAQQFCLLLIVLSCGGSLCAQQKDCNKPIVPVAARDKHDNFISGLQKGDFQAKVRGKGVDILSAAPGTAQPVVVVLDISGCAAQNVPDKIAQYYLIQIALPEPLVKDGSLQIGAINSTRQKGKDVELTFPESLPACTEPNAH